MHMAMRMLPLGLTVATTIVFGMANGASAQNRITIGDVGAGSANHWPAYIAMEKGFFDQEKVAIEFIPAPSSAAVQQQLASSSVDLGSGGLVDPIRAIDKGAPISLLRIEAGPPPYELLAKPTIKSYADLRGKTIMIGGIKDITRIYLERMLAPNGVKPGQYDLIFAGATAARLAALQSGSIDATLLNPPYNFKAKKAGFTSLGTAPQYVKDIPFTGYSANTGWAKQHKAEIDRFLKGYSRGVDWFYDPNNRTESIDILTKKLKLERDEVEKAYDFYVELHVFDRVGSITGSGVENLIKILKDMGDIEGPTDLKRFYDPAVAVTQ